MRHHPLAVVLLCVGVGCASEPITEVFLSVDVPDMLPEHTMGLGGDECGRAGQPPCDGVRIVQLDVYAPGEPSRMGLTAIVGPHERRVEVPVSWGIVARDPNITRFEVVAKGFVRGPDEAPVVEQHAQLDFRRDEVRTLCMTLAASCVGIACTADQTCVDGTCRRLCLDVGALPAWDEPLRCQEDWPELDVPCASMAPTSP